MIFNLQKNNTRNSIDIGDLRSYCLSLANTSKHLDRPTLAVIVEILDFISKIFDSYHPREREVVCISINEYNLKTTIKKSYKRNQKLSKKKSVIELEEITPPPNPEDIVFNQKQLKQIEELIKAPLKDTKETIQSSLLEVTKKILSSVEKPLEQAKTKKGQASAKNNS
ncbi:MAG: hypothetical protein NC087_10260 [Anaeroplasma bactoclasticum]|nr:hypothetical protein [Anaeroplasma bactoclasticum]